MTPELNKRLEEIKSNKEAPGYDWATASDDLITMVDSLREKGDESGRLSLRLLRENAALKDERDSLRQGVERLRHGLQGVMAALGQNQHYGWCSPRGGCNFCLGRAALRETEGLVKESK